MNRNRRSTVIALALAAISAPRLALAQQPGVNYSVLKPEQPVHVTQGKIEVLEFFWYGCIHCYNFEPAIEQWLRKLPPDVQFRRIPAVFNDRWGHDAAIFYSLEAMGVGERLHRPLFDAIHVDRLRTDDSKAFNAWLDKQGVDAKRFEDVMKSFGVQSKLRQARQVTIAYGIDGTPAMAVQGRYSISTDQGGSLRGMLSVVDHLIPLARKSLSVAR